MKIGNLTPRCWRGPISESAVLNLIIKIRGEAGKSKAHSARWNSEGKPSFLASKAHMQNVSVVMATLNGRRFIIEQLQSLLSQTVLPFEIVICDDGSTDGTVEAIECFSKTSAVPVVFVRNEKRLGYSNNFLKAAHLASSEYIAFCDQDDIWCSKKIETCMEFIADTGVEFCAHTVRLIDENGTPGAIHDQHIKKTEAIAPRSKDPWGVFYGFSQVFHCSILQIIPEGCRGEDSETFDMVLSHDRWVHFLASHFCKIGVINEPLVQYRQHSDNAYGARRTALKDKILRRTREGSYSLGQLTKIASHRVAILEANRTNSRARAFDLAITRWKTLHYFYELRFRLYSSPRLAHRFLLLAQCFCIGVYLPNRFLGLGPKRFFVDSCFGLFSRYLENWLDKNRKQSESDVT
jgi:glycosyltransferase involved in cell wall biosynthesis